MNEFLTYWRDNFGEFETEEGVFSIPGFLEPMMSINFNEIPDDVFIRTINRIRVQKESLQETATSTRFWEFLEEQYPDSVPFLEKLIPFLIQRGLPHFHYFIEYENQLLASQLIGISPNISFIFNGVVHKDYRNQGLLTEIINVIKTELPSDKAFYWTKYEWLNL